MGAYILKWLLAFFLVTSLCSTGVQTKKNNHLLEFEIGKEASKYKIEKRQSPEEIAMDMTSFAKAFITFRGVELAVDFCVSHWRIRIGSPCDYTKLLKEIEKYRDVDLKSLPPSQIKELEQKTCFDKRCENGICKCTNNDSDEFVLISSLCKDGIQEQIPSFTGPTGPVDLNIICDPYIQYRLEFFDFVYEKGGIDKTALSKVQECSDKWRISDGDSCDSLALNEQRELIYAPLAKLKEPKQIIKKVIEVMFIKPIAKLSCHEFKHSYCDNASKKCTCPNPPCTPQTRDLEKNCDAEFKKAGLVVELNVEPSPPSPTTASPDEKGGAQGIYNNGKIFSSIFFVAISKLLTSQ